MPYRITTQSPDAVLAAWGPAKQTRYFRFEDEAAAIAERHQVPLQTLTDALLLLSDLPSLFTWAEATDFLPVLVTRYASPTAR